MLTEKQRGFMPSDAERNMMKNTEKKSPAGDSTTNARAREAAAEWVPISELVPWDRNPRKNDGEPVRKVAESIKRFGFAAPIIARSADRVIIAGHTRWKAAKSLGLTEVPVRFVDLDPADSRLLALADNRLNEIAEWDVPELQSILSEFSFSDVDLAGWSSNDLEKMASDLIGGDDSEQPEAIEDEEVPEPPKVAITKPGDVWILGDHVLMCGDCRRAGDIAALFGDYRCAVAITSPPYASQRKYDEESGFQPIPPDAFVDWFDAVQANVRSVLAADGSWFVNIKEHAEDGQRHLYVKDLAIAHVRRWDWMLVDELCWYKRSLPGHWPNRFRNDWEPIFHFSMQKEIKFDPMAVAVPSSDAFEYVPNKGKTAGGNIGIGAEGRNRHDGLARPGNVIEISTRKVPNGIAHPAAFPADLPAFFIKAFSDAGDVVFDPFMGSGTTLIACEKEGRRARGMELSPNYCDVIVERWQNLTGRKAERRVP